ncbi:hypothetical protein BDN70DRAFT_916550 [Pholiota conissans]|uniref:Uncharacterized protein n=1 Tax=Pholiota conissans TaxID=109636 RepID=A0A9P5ZG53_9AGAR|nr:hypothetical protein BDN70DRAFT_916550 [Pholiota conissans]
MLSRAARVSQRLPPCRASLNQHFISRFASTEAVATNDKVKAAAVRTAYVRAWRPAENILEQWLMVREIEKRFGKVQETHFLKDYEDIGKYQMMSFIVFEDPKSLEKIPDTGVELTIPYRPSEKLNHEIGLEDVEPLLPSLSFSAPTQDDNQDVPVADPQNDSAARGFRILPSKTDYVPENVVRGWIYQQTSVRNMEWFQAWGGFADLEPSTQVVEDVELFNKPGLNEQKRMRAALALCARNARRNSPRFALPPIKESTLKAAKALEASVKESPPASTSTTISDTPAPASAESSATPAPAASDTPETFVTPPTPQATTPEASATKPESTPPKTPEPTSSKLTASQQPHQTTSKVVEAVARAKKTQSTKPAANAASTQPTPKASENTSKALKATTPKQAEIKLPPPVHESVAPVRRKQPKPKIQPIQPVQVLSRSSPLRSPSYAPSRLAETMPESSSETKTPAETAAGSGSAISKLWGLLTGKR